MATFCQATLEVKKVSTMGLLLLLAGGFLLLVAGFELWSFLTVSIFSLIMKAGLLRDIVVDPSTKISVTSAVISISLWPQLWKFLRAPKREKLLVFTLSSVRLLVIPANAGEQQLKQGQTSNSPPFWQLIDTSSGLKDIRHPMWSRVRVWIPRLLFLCRCIHAVELGVDSIDVDVAEKDQHSDKPVVSIQHASAFVNAFCDPLAREVVCSIVLSRTHPTKLTFQGLDDMTAELGRTEITVRVPVCHGPEDLRAPIPSAYSVVIDLIRLNFDLEHLWQTALVQKQQQQHCTETSSTSLEAAVDSPVEPSIAHILTILRLAEICPSDFRFEVVVLEVKITDKVPPRSLGSVCTLGLNQITVVLSSDVDDDSGRTNKDNEDYPVVTRKADLALGPLVIRLNEVGDTTNPPPMLKMDGLKVNAEGTLSADVTNPRNSEELDESDCKQPRLYFRSTISGGNRSLDVMISKKIEPWVASCCILYDRVAASLQGNSTSTYLIEETSQTEEQTAMDICEVEMDVHFKMLKTAITVISLDRTCDVLPKGVPSIGLSLGEISVYVHPFVNEDHLGVRAKADLQCSRLKAFYFTGTDLVKCPFLSLDFTRVFISPVATMMQSEVPAEVEMEAEWVEAKWAPEVLHAIGGAIELGIFTVASFLHESRRPSPESKGLSSRLEWKAASSLKVPPMRQMVDVAQDIISSDEIIVFRCVAKRICVIFPYIYNGQRRVECVTVDTLAVSSEGTTDRLRITIMDARAFPSQRAPAEISSTAKTTRKQVPIHRKSFASRASRNHRKDASTPKPPRAALDHDSAFLVAECFSIEENQVVGSTQTVVDLFVNGVQLEWDISTQLRVMELIRRITISAWEMIYRARSTYAIHCTPPESIYNRVHGLNPPLDDIHECLRCESLFPDLISASGDKLHRLHATNLSVNAKLGDKVDVRLTVGVFAGDDLPEVWLFEEITINVNASEMAVVGSVRVRHTLDKQNDYVFGEFEDMLRKRLLACDRSTDALDPTLADGIIVEINNCHLRTSCDFPLLSYVEAIQATFEPFKEQLASAVSSYWRPQQEVFYQYFLRTPVASHQQDLWLRLEDVGFECLGNPLDSWLERMYPVWIEELAEQELRAHMLDDHVASLELTNADLLSDGSYKEMKTLLKEKNARLYIHKVKKLLHETPSGDSGAILNVGIGHIDVDVSFEEDISASWTSIQNLDEAAQVLEDAFKTQHGHELAHFTPSYLLFMGIQLKATITDLTVRMRRFPTPLMTCDGLSVEGQVFVTAFSSGCADPVDLLAALRCFMDLSILVANPVLYFNPGYLFALNELAGLASSFLPFAVFDVDRRFQTTLVDITRRLIHGKIGVTVKDASVRLLCTATSFDSADFLEVSVHRVRVAYSCGSIDVEVTRVAARIEPGSLSHVAELSHLKLQVWLKWDCLGNPSLHYFYPVEFVGAKSLNTSCEHFILRPPGIDEAPNPLQMYQATTLSVFISGRICPVGPDNGDSNDGWTKRDMATRTAVVLYSKSVEWLIGFGRIYQNIPQYPLPRRRQSAKVKIALPSTDILSILEGVTIEEFDLIGLDMALYASEKHPVGLRAFIDDKISCSGAFLRSSHEIFGVGGSAVRRLSLIIDDSTWIVHDVNVDAREIQVRVCTPQSGSRGEALVSLKHVALIVGGGIERAPTHDNGLMKLYSPPPMKRLTNSLPFSFPQPAKGSGEVKERSKQSILEFFHIPNENPFSFRESDSDTEGEIDVREAEAVESEVEELQNLVLDEFRRAGFLLGLLSKEVRVTVTMVALGSLVDIADTWVKVAITNLPELFNGEAEAAALMKRKENKEEELDVIMEESDPSPKKFTSLAQDPKFSGISLQGGADTPTNRDTMQRFEPTPYSNADTVRPVKRKSTVVVSQLEQIRSQDETTVPQVTNSKLTQAFIMVKFEDCQISVQDQLHKGSVLLALNAGTLQHAVSSDSSHERIDLNVDGFQVFTAPLDVDVKSHAIWLKALADGSYCPSSHGLLRQVIAPIPAQVTIWIDREKSIVKNKVKLDIPAIEVQMNLVSKDILEKLTTTATELVNTKLAQKKKADHSHRLQSYLRENQHQKRSLNQLVALKKQLKWKIAALEWRQMCGWDYRMNERAIAAVSASESARNLAFEVETSPLFRRRKMSSASVISVAPNISFAGSTATHRYEDEHFTDELHRMTQQYEGLSELTRFMASELQKQLKPSPLPNVDLEFALDRASLTLSGENVDILRAQVGSLCFKMQLLEDHSGNFALALQDLSVRNLSPGTPYPDMLLPVYSRSWEGDDMFLRIDAEIAKPVGGVTIVQHFEVNVHPIQVCITQEAIMQLVAFFSPSDRANSTKDEQREEVRSQFLQARTASSSVSDGRVGSAIIKAVKVAGKAAAHPLSLGRTHRGDSDEEAVSSGRKGKGGGLHHIAEDPAHWISKLSSLSESNDLPIFGSSDEADHHIEEQEISEMKDRAKNNILFKRIRLGAVEVVLTYKNKKNSLVSSTPHLHLPHAPQPQALEDMRGFEVKTHALVYCDKACSPLDLLLRIRRDILLDVLSQVGRNFTNIGNFLRDQFDPSRWAAFDALAPLKSLSTTVSSLTAHTGAVVPLTVQPDASNSLSPSENKPKDVVTSNASTPTSVRASELLCEWQRRSSDLLSDHYDADSSAPSSPTCTDAGLPKQIKAKRSLTRLFTRKKSISSPQPSPSTQ